VVKVRDGAIVDGTPFGGPWCPRTL